jgi:arylsulfatase A-like enzyme
LALKRWPLSVTTPRVAQSQQPSILVIETDDMRVDDLDAMPKTRALLIDGGMSFDNFTVGGTPLCCPSRASALTGLYPHNHVGRGNCRHLTFRRSGFERTTIAVALTRTGNATAFLGKYLNTYSPQRRPVPPGWRHWFAFTGPSDCRRCNGDGGGYYNYLVNRDGELRVFGEQPGDYSTDVLTTRALEIIQGNPTDTPLFMWVNPFAPHNEPMPAPRHAEVSVPDLAATPAYDNIGTGKSVWMQDLAPLTPELDAHIDQLNTERRRTLLAVDDMVEQLVAAMPSGSYVFFLSDNGYMCGELRLLLGKHVPYKPSAEVPLLVRGPGISPGHITATVTSSVDLVPTWAELASTPLEWPVDGISLVPELHQSRSIGRDSVLLQWVDERANSTADQNSDDEPATPAPASSSDETIDRSQLSVLAAARYVPPTYNALRGDAWLYIEWADGFREYYDYNEGPFELDNRYEHLTEARKSALAERVKQLGTCRGQDGSTTCIRAAP